MAQDDSIIGWHLARRPQIPYYRIVNGNGFWEPNARMKKVGFVSTPCGPDGPEAHAKAWALNTEWQRVRTSGEFIRRLASASIGYIYFLVAGDAIKIGFTTRPTVRIEALKTGLAEKIESIVIVRGSRSDEKRLHALLVHYRRNGEWFMNTDPVREVMARSAAKGRPAFEAVPTPLLRD